MDTRILDVDPLAGIVRKFHYDYETDTTTIETIQEVEDLVDINTALRNSSPSRWASETMNRVASMPANVYYDLKRKGIIDDPKAFAKWLNDRDNRKFRVRDGYV